LDEFFSQILESEEKISKTKRKRGERDKELLFSPLLSSPLLSS